MILIHIIQGACIVREGIQVRWLRFESSIQVAVVIDAEKVVPLIGVREVLVCGGQEVVVVCHHIVIENQVVTPIWVFGEFIYVVEDATTVVPGSAI